MYCRQSTVIVNIIQQVMTTERQILIETGRRAIYGPSEAQALSAQTSDEVAAPKRRELIITSTAFYALVIGLAVSTLATLGVSIAFGVYAANNANGTTEATSGQEVPTGMLQTADGSTIPNVLIRSAANKPIDATQTSTSDTTTTSSTNSKPSDQPVYVSEFRNFIPLPSTTASFTRSTESRSITPSRDYGSYAPHLSKEQVDSSFSNVHTHLDIHYKDARGLLYSDGSFHMATGDDPVTLACFCLGQSSSSTVYCEPVEIKEGGAIGCLTTNCVACLGILSTGPHGPIPTQGTNNEPVDPHNPNGNTIEGVFLRQTLEVDTSRPAVVTDEHGPVTDPNFWNEASFSDLSIEEIQPILTQIGSYETMDENDLVWAMYRVQTDRKALLMVPRSALPRDAFYLHAPLSAKIQCRGACMSPYDPDKAVRCYDIHAMMYYSCGGCTNNCRFYITY